jgi:hypothetical protein
MKESESITAKLERIVSNFQDEVCEASAKPNAHLQKNLTELVEGFGYKAVKAAVDASDGDLSVDDGPDTSLDEALLGVPAYEPDEESDDA